jgi:glycosyltransferase involved in cell wall biosynthesis
MIWQLLDSRTVGGIERHVEVLARHLHALGVATRIVLLASYPEQPSLALFEGAGALVSVLDGRFRTLLDAIRAEAPALIHAHGYRANVMARFAGLAAGVPVVTSYHAGLREPFPVGVYQLVDEWTGFLSGRIAVSEMIRARLPFDAALLENFVDVPEQPPVATGTRIVFVGRLTPEKGPDLFCELARATQTERASACEWHLFGDGPMRNALAADYARHVTFHGFVSDMEAIWRDAGLLVMTSRAEGLPMAALEAIARGVPVVAADVGGLPRIAVPGVSGWLFPAGNLASARKALDEWLAMGQAAQAHLSRSAWSYAKAHFSAEAGMAKLARIYERCAGRDVLAGAGEDLLKSPVR